MKITMDGKYTTRDGKPVRIFALDGGGAFPVMGAIFHAESGRWISRNWSETGSSFTRDITNSGDLIPAVEKPREYELWVNAYPSSCVAVYHTRAEADKSSAPTRIACVHVKYTNGEGL